MDSVPQLLTIAQTAAQLGCSISNVYGLIASGRLPYVAVGRRKGYRISVDDLRRFIASRTSEKQQPETTPVYRPRLRHIRL